MSTRLKGPFDLKDRPIRQTRGTGRGNPWWPHVTRTAVPRLAPEVPRWQGGPALSGRTALGTRRGRRGRRWRPRRFGVVRRVTVGGDGRPGFPLCRSHHDHQEAQGCFVLVFTSYYLLCSSIFIYIDDNKKHS